MNGNNHQGCIRCSCWHSTNPRIVLSGGDDRSIRLWRLYPPNSVYPHTSATTNNDNNDNSKNKPKPTSSRSNGGRSYDDDDDDDVELGMAHNGDHASDDDDDPNKFVSDFDPSIQPLAHLLSMPASGEVKALCMSPYDGEILVATSSRLFNQKSSLDILSVPHWTWNYASPQRLPYKLQLREKYRLQQKRNASMSTSTLQGAAGGGDDDDDNELNLVISSLDDELDAEKQRSNPFLENQSTEVASLDFVSRPSVIPLPYGARERCLTFSPSPDIVFVGLLSCRKKHQRRYCCVMACNILNGASRPCRKMNALLDRKECIYAMQLTCMQTSTRTNTNENDNKRSSSEVHSKTYRLALGTNLGRLIVVTLKHDLSWTNTQRSFITEYTVAFPDDPMLAQPNGPSASDSNHMRPPPQQQQQQQQQTTSSNAYGGAGNTSSSSAEPFGDDEKHEANGASAGAGGQSAAKKKKDKHHRKVSSKFSVLTARERCFREMADPTTVTITYASMRTYLWNQSSQIDEQDIREFFTFLKPNRKQQITFTQFVQRVDTDGDFMRAFEQFCVTGSSRTDRRPWMDDIDDEDDIDDGSGSDSQRQKSRKQTMSAKRKNKALAGDEEEEAEDSDWELAMLNNRCGDALPVDQCAVTAIAWNHSDNWLITGHQDGDVKFWSKEFYTSQQAAPQNRFLPGSRFYYVCRGSMKRHSEPISCLSLSGTYLVSSSQDGNILIWHLDFLLPSVRLPMNITVSSRGIIQLLASINSAHLGDEVCDVQLSTLTQNVAYCVPSALFLLSCGADENVRCRDVMTLLRQQLTERILAESQPKKLPLMQSSDTFNAMPAAYPTYENYVSHRNVFNAATHTHDDGQHDIMPSSAVEDSDDNSDFGATTYD